MGFNALAGSTPVLGSSDFAELHSRHDAHIRSVKFLLSDKILQYFIWKSETAPKQSEVFSYAENSACEVLCVLTDQIL